jgi:hypothetical protein
MQVLSMPRRTCFGPSSSEQRGVVTGELVKCTRRAAQGFTHAGFDSGSLATAAHRELFEQTVRLPSRKP